MTELARQKEIEAAAVAAARGALVRNLQEGLERVGCNPGTLDGRWGETTRTALAKFADQTKSEIATDEPTQAAIDRLDQFKARVCLPPARPVISCDNDETLVNGRCELKKQPAARVVARPQVAPSRGGMQCMDYVHAECEVGVLVHLRAKPVRVLSFGRAGPAVALQ